ncbi:hypothetical protein RBU49_02900 [Clostridium sp. MB40-C1]|uniref:hypothetical protein n=1 Tax=Clostridium sp. MB40-C1 TaxID=3070996 RepID=UPI0027DEADF9|nr:hypothetical protein [Clostridium sp. MB40-C1]WMJ81218.1 hypothetical protein RBU49_02900 [Clostridium sp. MB40-C1]
MEYSINKYNLIIRYDDESKEEYVTGFKEGSSIIYNKPNNINIGKNGKYVDNSIKGSIEFYLKTNSSSIKTLSRLERCQEIFTIQIVDAIGSGDVKVSGTNFKIVSKKNNTNWVINDFCEDYTMQVKSDFF